MNNETYQKLDRSALWLLIGEFGGAALLLVLLLLIVVGNLISDNAFDWDYSTGELVSAIMAFVYGLAYLGNLVIGVIGLYIYATEKREGNPGTGHMLNWTLLSATLVIVLVLIAAIISSI